MVNPWSSMESSTSPSTDSGPSASTNDYASSNQHKLHHSPITRSNVGLEFQGNTYQSNIASNKTGEKLVSTQSSSENNNAHISSKQLTTQSKVQVLSLNFEQLSLREEFDSKVESTGRRKPHFLDDDYKPPPRNNNDVCKIPKPHFLDQSPSPDDSNFLDDEQIEKNVDVPIPPKRNVPPSDVFSKERDRPHTSSQNFSRDSSECRSERNHFRTHLHRGLEQPSTLAERDKRTTQLYHGTWPGERDLWPGGQDSVSVKSFSSAGSANAPQGGGVNRQSHLGTKVDCVYSLLSLLSLSPDNNADMSDTLLEMSQSVESCIAMRQSGCIPLLVQLVHSKLVRSTKNKAAQALYNIIHAQPDDKAGRREARVWRLLEQVREYCYILEDLIELRKECKEELKDDMTKHPGQSVAALMKLSFDEEHRHVMCQFGGLQALATLVSTDQETHGSLVEDSQCVTMRKYAGMALTNLTFGDGNNKALLCSFKDFMLALVDQLKSPNDDMRQVTAAVLRNLSWRADTTSKQTLREVGAVKGLTLAAMSCHKEATLKSILSALWNLTAHCSLNKVGLCSVEGALGFLVDMLSFNAPSKTLAIIENSGGILRNVSSHIAVDEDYREILRERSCLKILLQQLKSPSLTIVSNSCGTLWNLSARCPQDQQYLWDHGAVPMLRSLIHSKHKMIAMGSSAALKNLLNSKPGKSHIVSLDSTARSMNLPVLPTLGARKQKALEQDIDQSLSETCDNIEPATSPSTSNRDEKILYSAAERQLSMNLDRHKNPMNMGHTSHNNFLNCSNALLQSVPKSAHISRSTVIGRSDNVNRSESKDSVTSTHSDSVYERVVRNTQFPMSLIEDNVGKAASSNCNFFKPTVSKSDRDFIKRYSKGGGFVRYNSNEIIPDENNQTNIVRNKYSESGYDIDQESCDQPFDYSQKYSETKIEHPTHQPLVTSIHNTKTAFTNNAKPKLINKDSTATFGDYQETDLDQPTDYSLRYAEDQSENNSVISEPPGPSIHEDTIKYFCTEGTPYETPINFSTATSMSDLRTIGAGNVPQDNAHPRESRKVVPVKVNSEVMTQSDEKDTCSIEESLRHDNDVVANSLKEPIELAAVPPVTYESKFSSGMISPEKPVNYCEEGTPGYFSRVSSLSSLEEGAEIADVTKNDINVLDNSGHYTPPSNASTAGRDKEGSKAVTFASDPITLEMQQNISNDVGVTSSIPNYAEETPLMFSRCSSLGSLSGCSVPDQGSVVSEFSRMTSGCISPSELPDSPGQSIPHSPVPPTSAPIIVPVCAEESPKTNKSMETKKDIFTGDSSQVRLRSVFEDAVSTFQVEHTPIEFSTATSLSSLTIDDEPTSKEPILKTTPQEQVGDKFTKQSHQPLKDDEDQQRDLATDGSSSSASDDGKSGEDGSDKEDDILAACISAGMQSKIKTRTQTPASPMKINCGPISTSSPKHLSKIKVTDVYAELQPASDTCRSYCTEDTPAILSKAGSQSNLSVLSIETNTDIIGDLLPLRNSAEPFIVPAPTQRETGLQLSDYGDTRIVDSSDDSSNLSADSGNLLAECIRSGMPKGMQDYDLSDRFKTNRKALSDRGKENINRQADNYQTTSFSSHVGNVYRSDIRGETPPPPLPPKAVFGVPPPPPPYPHQNHTKSDELIPLNLDRNDSLSSLSIDSLGSTDGELLFQQCVRSGLPKPNPKYEDIHTKTVNKNFKARSAERSQEIEQVKQTKFQHKSLERSKSEQKIEKRTPRDPEFERLVAIGAYGMRTIDKMTRTEDDLRDKALLEEAIYSGMPKRKSKLESVQLNNNHPLAENQIGLQSNTIPNQGDKLIKTTSNTAVNASSRKHSDVKVPMQASNQAIVQITDSGGYQCKTSSSKNVEAPSAGAAADHRVAPCDDADGQETSLNRGHPTSIPQPHLKPALSPEDLNNTDRGDAPDHPVILKNGFEAFVSQHGQSNGDSYADKMRKNTLTHVNNDLGSPQCNIKRFFSISSTNSLSEGNEKQALNDSVDSNTLLECAFDRSNEYPALDCSDLLHYSSESEEKTDLNQSNESFANILNQSGLSAEGDLDPNPLLLSVKVDTDTPIVIVSNAEYAESMEVNRKELAGSNSAPPFPIEWIKSNEANNDNKTFLDLMEPNVDTRSDNPCIINIATSVMSSSDLLSCSNINVSPSRLLNLPKEEAVISGNLNKLDSTNKGQPIESDATPINENGNFLTSIPRSDEPLSFSFNISEPTFSISDLESISTNVEAVHPTDRQVTVPELLIQSISSTNSLDLDNVKPPFRADSFLSLTPSVSGYWNDHRHTASEREKSPLPMRKNAHKITRKKSLPVALMVKRALNSSCSNHGSSEHLDCHNSLLDYVKPPSEMDYILDLESSILSVASITSDVADAKERTVPSVFDLKQPFHLSLTVENLDHVEPPSLFEELQDYTSEYDQEQSVAVVPSDDFTSDRLVRSGSENDTSLPLDYANSGAESTPKKHSLVKRRLTPKQKRQITHDRFKTYTISDHQKEQGSDSINVTLEADRSDADYKTEDCVPSVSHSKDVKLRISPKQRRIDDRARYQTQTVNVSSINIPLSDSNPAKSSQSIVLQAATNSSEMKKSVRQKRMENADRFKTQIISGSCSIDTTTPESAVGSNSTSFQVSPAAYVDRINRSEALAGSINDGEPSLQIRITDIDKDCLEMNMRNIAMCERPPSFFSEADDRVGSNSDRNSLECDQNSGTESADQNQYSDVEQEVIQHKIKPKIVKPSRQCRDESLDSNCSTGNDDRPKGIRGRQKTAYVSPYRRNAGSKKSPVRTLTAKITSSNKGVHPKASTVKNDHSVRSTSQTACRNVLKSASQSKSLYASVGQEIGLGKQAKAVKSNLPQTNHAKLIPLERQGTFTMEESSVLLRKSPILLADPEKSPIRQIVKSSNNTSPSRLPQPNRKNYLRQPLRKTWSNETAPSKFNRDRSINFSQNGPSQPMKNSTSNHSLQSTESSKTITTKSAAAKSRGNPNVVNQATKTPKEVTSRIANLWKKVEQKKTQQAKPDNRVWITNGSESGPCPRVSAADEASPVRISNLIRSSTFDGPPATEKQVAAPPKQKSSIAIRVSQIPSSRYSGKTVPKLQEKPLTNASNRSTPNRLFLRKPAHQEMVT